MASTRGEGSASNTSSRAPPVLSESAEGSSKKLTQSWGFRRRSGWPGSDGGCCALLSVAKASALSHVVPDLGKLARKMSSGLGSKRVCTAATPDRIISGSQKPLN